MSNISRRDALSLLAAGALAPVLPRFGAPLGTESTSIQARSPLSIQASIRSTTSPGLLSSHGTETTTGICAALGGGGAKGFSHIGVIKVLESHGIKPKIVTGTSAGSFVGSIYASGQTPYQLQSLALA